MCRDIQEKLGIVRKRSEEITNTAELNIEALRDWVKHVVDILEHLFGKNKPEQPTAAEQTE